MRRDILISREEIVAKLLDRCSGGVIHNDYDHVICEVLRSSKFTFDDDSSIRFKTEMYKSVPGGIYVITFDYHINYVDSTVLRFELEATCKVHRSSKYADVVYWFFMGI